MKKIIISLCIVLSFAFAVSAQSLDPQSIEAKEMFETSFNVNLTENQFRPKLETTQTNLENWIFVKAHYEANYPTENLDYITRLIDGMTAKLNGNG